MSVRRRGSRITPVGILAAGERVRLDVCPRRRAAGHGIIGALLCALSIGCSASSPPLRPVARATVGPSKTLEVVGLRRWSLGMIQDSLAKYAPGETLASHACVANLRYKLGFVDADVFTTIDVVVYDTDSTRTEHITVLVREPQDSARAHPLRVAIDDSALQAEWRPVTGVFLTDVRLFRTFYQAYLQNRGPEELTRQLSGRDSVQVAAMFKVLAAEQTDSGYARATRVLRASGSNPDRSVAALILSRFPERDEAWHTLVMGAVEDHQWLDSEIAQEALEVMSEHHPRRVDWQPVALTLRHVLDGTALPALIPVVGVINRTGVDQRSAATLLRGGGEMLTALLELSRKDLSDPAHTLLVTLRGQDLGRDPTAWRQWIATLDKSRSASLLRQPNER